MTKLKNKIIFALFPAILMLSGCEKAKPDSWVKAQDEQFFTDFRINNQDAYNTILSKGSTLSYNLEHNRFYNYSLHGNSETNGMISLFGITDTIRTWSVSCTTGYQSCSLRFRNGERESSNVVGFSLTFKNMSKVLQMIDGYQVDRDKFVPTRVKGSSYIYNRYSVYSSLNGEVLSLMHKDNRLVIKTEDVQGTDTFVEISPEMSKEIGEQLRLYSELFIKLEKTLE